MKILCLADLHGHLKPEVRDLDFDVLVIAGDICHDYDKNTVYSQTKWLTETFNKWLDKMPQPKVVVASNHDLALEKVTDLGAKLHCNYLYNSEITLRVNGDEVKFWGSPESLEFNHWAFNKTEAELEQIYSGIPDEVDVIISHGPPFGFGDYYKKHLGSRALLHRIHQMQGVSYLGRKPKLVVTGHIHEGYGEYLLGPTTVVNASLCNGNYRPINPIQIFDF